MYTGPASGPRAHIHVPIGARVILACIYSESYSSRSLPCRSFLPVHVIDITIKRICRPFSSRPALHRSVTPRLRGVSLSTYIPRYHSCLSHARSRIRREWIIGYRARLPGYFNLSRDEDIFITRDAPRIFFTPLAPGMLSGGVTRDFFTSGMTLMAAAERRREGATTPVSNDRSLPRPKNVSAGKSGRGWWVWEANVEGPALNLCRCMPAIF